MLLVNLTALSDGAIHNRFDKYSNNDPVAASAWRKKIEADFENYASDATLLANGTVRPCTKGVWTAAIAVLREEQPGNFFVPCYAPRKK